LAISPAVARFANPLALLMLASLSFASGALAQENLSRERSEPEFFEDKHLFGFTEGSDVGEAGSREAEFTTTGAFGKRGGGAYQAIGQEAAYEAAATDRFGYELIALGSWQSIANVPGFDNLSQANFAGLAVQPKYIFLRRGLDAPFGLSVSLTPAWLRIDDISGVRATNFSLETRLYLDKEFIPQKLLGAVNVLYAPETGRDALGPSHYALFGATGALSYLFTPEAFLGGELEYYQAWQSLGFSNSAGSAFYAGPTLHLQLGAKAFVSLAWSAQLSNSPRHPAPERLVEFNQSDLARQRGHMVFGVEF
jgi:hypothetical protein